MGAGSASPRSVRRRSTSAMVHLRIGCTIRAARHSIARVKSRFDRAAIAAQNRARGSRRDPMRSYPCIIVGPPNAVPDDYVEKHVHEGDTVIFQRTEDVDTVACFHDGRLI